ncbi:MAG: hypothetical protein HKO66_14480 [Saprospiraceae bacterium]|nr:hypothetical protein [Bacteroidia bacterium]NNE14197.1 hypothetical protein [Saprospiraceae bacterium]NNL93444.1 hypothetical protein [Saprospiraceae bacterium]
MRNQIFFCFIIALLFSCKGDGVKSDFVDLDLMSYGMPIKIKSPTDPVISKDDLGIVKEVTVKKGDGFYIQILSGKSYIRDIHKLVAQQKSDASESKYFSKIIEETDNGFIFEKKYPELDDRITYDFRYIKIQGDNQFTFQAGLMGQYTLDEIKAMFTAVQ